jgi:hypothetical protein
MPADWLLVLAAVRRALASAADPGRSCLESLRLAPSGSRQLGQQYCPIQNMANSGLQYKGLPKRMPKHFRPDRDKK